MHRVETAGVSFVVGTPGVFSKRLGIWVSI